MSNWSAIAALGEAAKGAGSYFGSLTAMKVKEERLAQARAEKIADVADARKYAGEQTADERKYLEGVKEGDRVYAEGEKEELWNRQDELLADANSRADSKQAAQNAYDRETARLAAEAAADKISAANSESDRRAKRDADIADEKELLKDDLKNGPARAAAKQESTDLINLAQSLVDDKEGMKGAVGSLDGRFIPSFKEKTVNWENRFEAVKSKLTLTNLDKMVGVLSNTDIEILATAAANGLKLTSDEAQNEAQLNALIAYEKAKQGVDPYAGKWKDSSVTRLPDRDERPDAVPLSDSARKYY